MLEILGAVLVIGILVILTMAGAAVGTILGIILLLAGAGAVCMVLGAALLAVLELVVKVVLAVFIASVLQKVFNRGLEALGRSVQVRWLCNEQQRGELALAMAGILAAWVCFVKF